MLILARKRLLQLIQRIIDMFLLNKDSFVLIRGKIVKPSFPVFLPNSDSFVLVKRTAPTSTEGEVGAPTLSVGTDFSTESTSSTSLDEARDKTLTTGSSPQADSEESEVNDQSKRTFLKVASVAGAGIIASQLSPKRASALIMGSSPTTGIIGVKDSTNTRINPATEETVSSLLKPSDLTFDAGSLQVKVTSTSGDGSSSFSDSESVAKSGLVDADRHLQVDVLSSALPSAASTETTLQTISFGGFKFSLRLATDGAVDYIGEAAIGTATSAASWRIKKVDSTSGVAITWAGTGVFNQVWDNHASLSYS